MSYHGARKYATGAAVVSPPQTGDDENVTHCPQSVTLIGRWPPIESTVLQIAVVKAENMVWQPLSSRMMRAFGSARIAVGVGICEVILSRLLVKLVSERVLFRVLFKVLLKVLFKVLLRVLFSDRRDVIVLLKIVLALTRGMTSGLGLAIGTFAGHMVATGICKTVIGNTVVVAFVIENWVILPNGTAVVAGLETAAEAFADVAAA